MKEPQDCRDIFDIRRPGHIPALIEQRRKWAKEYGVDQDFVAQIHQILVDHSFDVPADLFKKAQKR